VRKLTDDDLIKIAELYPELKAFAEVAKSSCSIRSSLPAMIRSRGKRDGIPESIAWIFDPSLLAGIGDPRGDPQAIFTEMLGELKGIRELLTRLTEKTLP
jgi:hypothetical protein